MNKKWEQRKTSLNKEKIILNMSHIQENIIEISRLDFSPSVKDLDKVTAFKEYSENFLNNIKNSS